ncbi:cobalamin biosynthesis protein [Streptomyces phaeolivaceus]|uniref:Cobalamin biosynthesis protein n=1 Tax=Streptomyces phaeolivaceus TaxID=2653200 RepID=A0A5P8JZD3_9ACTN|nr:cobalamin biosynthesis protein [Streptomyces phaeolivaceus]
MALCYRMRWASWLRRPGVVWSGWVGFRVRVRGGLSRPRGGAAHVTAPRPQEGGAAVADRRIDSLVVGVGAAIGVSVVEVLGLVESALREAGVSRGDVSVLATVDARAGEPGLVQAAERLGVPLVSYPAEELAAVAVPNPSGTALAAVGTASVAEAAALVGGGELLVPKRKSEPVDGRAGRVTCAVARRPA